MTDDRVQKIQKTSRRFRLLFGGLLVVIPAVNVLFWLGFNHLPPGFLDGMPVVIARPLPFWVLASVFLVNLLPVGVAMYGMAALRKLFGLYERGIIFSAETVACFRRLGWSVILWVLASTLFQTAASVLFTLGNPPGQKQLVIQFSSNHLAVIIAGGIVILIARIMDQGRMLQDEQALTV